MVFSFSKALVSGFLVALGGGVVVGKAFIFGNGEELEPKNLRTEEIEDKQERSQEEGSLGDTGKSLEESEGSILTSREGEQRGLSDGASSVAQVAETFDNDPPPPKPVCTIYVTDTPTPSYGSKRRITRIFKKFENMDSFLSGEAKNSSNSFKKDLRDACNDRKEKSSIDVYVWGSDRSWYYSGSIQHDWINVNGIIKSFENSRKKR